MNESRKGQLFVCPTPIGNLSDVTFRVIETLKFVDIIACEDTRDSGKFLSHYDIHTPLTSYHDHNRIGKGEKLIEMLYEGKNIALISDAGMPGISDPGEDLIRKCIDEEINFTILPGPSAGITALVGSGLETGRFVFEGFLPRKTSERKERLEDIRKEKRTIILYESPHHLKKTLVDLKKVLGFRKITITRELTKKFEERIYTDTENAVDIYEEKDPRGEYVLIIQGRSKEEESREIRESFSELTLKEHMKMYEDKGNKRNEAMKLVAKDLGITKREVYSMLIEKEN